MSDPLAAAREAVTRAHYGDRGIAITQALAALEAKAIAIGRDEAKGCLPFACPFDRCNHEICWVIRATLIKINALESEMAVR